MIIKKVEKYLFFCYYLFILAQEYVHANQLLTSYKGPNKNCTTSDNQQGHCLYIEDCPSVAHRKKIKPTDFSSCSQPNQHSKKLEICCETSPIIPTRHYKKKLKFFSNTITNVFPKKCGFQKRIWAGRITGGTEADLGEFPWMALLIFRTDKSRISGCSGFLIHARFVLTAAHCVHKDSSSYVEFFGPPYSVALGEHDTTKSKDCVNDNTTCSDKIRYRRILEIIIHPNYTGAPQYTDDIALLHLKSGAGLSNFIFPICLWTQLNEPRPSRYIVSGWGKTQTYERKRSTVKLKVEVPPFDKDQCSKKYPLMELRESQICAGGEKNKDSCDGDSGGPLMFAPISGKDQWYAGGIVSYGNSEKCGKPGMPGVYTNVTYYISWISKMITYNRILHEIPVHKKKREKKRICTICR